jgi:hypothetical protein
LQINHSQSSIIIIGVEKYRCGTTTKHDTRDLPIADVHLTPTSMFSVFRNKQQNSKTTNQGHEECKKGAQAKGIEMLLNLFMSL